MLFVSCYSDNLRSTLKRSKGNYKRVIYRIKGLLKSVKATSVWKFFSNSFLTNEVASKWFDVVDLCFTNPCWDQNIRDLQQCCKGGVIMLSNSFEIAEIYEIPRKLHAFNLFPLLWSGITYDSFYICAKLQIS